MLCRVALGTQIVEQRINSEVFLSYTLFLLSHKYLRNRKHVLRVSIELYKHS